MQIDYKENSNRNVGLVVTTLLHACLLLLIFIPMAWKPLDGAPGSSGTELNFGLDDFGMGDNNDLPSTTLAAAPPVQEVIQEQPTPLDENGDVETEQKTTEKKPDPVKPPKDQVVVNKNTTTQTNTETSNKTNTTQTATRQQDGRTLMGNGDKNKAGDQGNPNGSLDARALYGNNGKGNGGNGNGGTGTGGDGMGGNGSSLSMTGWKWSRPPKVVDNSNESGKIVFKITVDEDGNIIAVVPVEKQVSASVAKAYEQAVWNLDFEKTKDFVKAAENSTGYITFIIRSK